jgi:hypothetical protein
MIYMFIGVSIISDRFMASIEVITSKEKEIKVKRPNGETQIVVVRVWNETVANLTLMALGSSAPEILLSIIEIYAKNFEHGDLGPGTIVGELEDFLQHNKKCHLLLKIILILLRFGCFQSSCHHRHLRVRHP